VDEIESGNVTPLPFARSAQKALLWLSVLLKQAQRRAVPRSGPHIRTILTQCQEIGCELPELESYYTEQSAAPALVLFGGDSHLAECMARALMLAATFPEMKPSTLIWEVKGGDYETCVLCYGASKRRISMSALTTFLQKSITADNIVWIRQTAPHATEAEWRFLWVPWPDKLETSWKSPESIGILARQHGAVIVLDNTPPALLSDLRELGQRRWEFRQEELRQNERMACLESEISALLETAPSQQAAREAAIWQWVRNRCQVLLESQRDELQKAFDRQSGSLKRLEQLLAQYRQNWLHGFRNQVESHFRRQRNTPSLQKLLKGKEIKVRSFLESIALGALRSKLEHFADERLAELVVALGAIAVKMNLPRLSLRESQTQWRAHQLAAKLETMLTERDVFASSENGRPLVKKLTGRRKNQEEERQNQIEMAIDLTTGLVLTDWSGWCTDFLVEIRTNIADAVDASLVAAGQSTPAQLRDKIARMDAVIRSLHADQIPRAAQARDSAKNLLKALAHRHTPQTLRA
jgi:hypothetical protein